MDPSFISVGQHFGSGKCNVSLESSLDHLLEVDIVIFITTKLSFDELSEIRERCFLLTCLCWRFLFHLDLLSKRFSLSVRSCKTSSIICQRLSVGIPSSLDLPSRDMISVSVELCLTDVCFLHVNRLAQTWNSPDALRLCKVIREVNVSRQILSALWWIVLLSVNTVDKYLRSKIWNLIWLSVCHKLYPSLCPLLSVS